MELFIRIVDGQPFEHPILGDNFRQAFPDIDVNNLPEGFARFERIQAPPLGVYEKNQRVQYERSENGIYRDVWYCDQISEEKKLEMQNAVKAQWAETGITSWTFNEALCSFVPPVARPTDYTKPYRWDEATTSWVELTLPCASG